MTASTQRPPDEVMPFARVMGTHAARWRRLLPVVIIALIAGCGTQAAKDVNDVVDGVAVGPTLDVGEQAFHRLEASARAKWAATHEGTTPVGYEVHARTEGTADFLMVVTVNGSARHVLLLHCDPVTFPAADSCS